ncbi:GNAT family N-acetyltransferase [Streptomyces sp. NPDC051183]|uniref:GNAT family N-acetyltransferase n=1 Tax=unclassified Streptomyces TaxID=2593676 RepID=UPI003445334C
MNWKIERVEGASLDLDEVLEVYRASGLGERRPIEDTARFRAMLDNANLVLVARDGDKLIGIARSVSDFSYVTYLSDIAVDRTHQRGGIGRALIEATQKETPGVKIVLLSAPAAAEYYPHIGFTQHGSAWVLNP